MINQSKIETYFDATLQRLARRSNQSGDFGCVKIVADPDCDTNSFPMEKVESAT